MYPFPDPVPSPRQVFQLTSDYRVRLMAGKPLQCTSRWQRTPPEQAAQTTLVSPQSLAFSPGGDLLVAESDSQRVNRVRVIQTDGSIQPLAGGEPKCNCREEDCRCFDEEHVLASDALLGGISALAVTPDGAVHISDQANYRIRTVSAPLPAADQRGSYHIHAPDAGHTYIFNRFGAAHRDAQHRDASYAVQVHVQSEREQRSAQLSDRCYRQQGLLPERLLVPGDVHRQPAGPEVRGDHVAEQWTAAAVHHTRSLQHQLRVPGYLRCVPLSDPGRAPWLRFS